MAALTEARRQALALCQKKFCTLKRIFSVLSLYSEVSDELLYSWHDEVEFLAKILLALIDEHKSRSYFRYAEERYEAESDVFDSLDKGGHTGYGCNTAHSQGLENAREEMKKSDAQLKKLYQDFFKVLEARLAVKN